MIDNIRTCTEANEIVSNSILKDDIRQSELLCELIYLELINIAESRNVELNREEEVDYFRTQNDSELIRRVCRSTFVIYCIVSYIC